MMELDPSENVDGTLLMCAQLYDRREMAVLLDALAPGQTFVDVGAHLGFYSFRAAQRVGPTGRVLAIEADPRTHARLQANVRLNPGLRVATAGVAVSDEEGTARLALNTTGNRAGNSLVVAGSDTIEVRCRPLAAILADNAIERVDGMKLDVEGMEYRVLRRYLADVPAERRPRIVVLEHQTRWIDAAGGDALALMTEAGYRPVLVAGINRVLVRS
jgi:FkbM family methyltransferase